MSQFKPNKEDVKQIINQFKDKHGNPVSCTDEQAQAVLDNYYAHLDDHFYEFVKDEYMDSDIFSEIVEEWECR